jgi:hypothetical protein
VQAGLDGDFPIQPPKEIPARVAIRAVSASGPQRSLADLTRAIAAEQRSRGLPGRSAQDLRADDARLADDA